MSDVAIFSMEWIASQAKPDRNDEKRALAMTDDETAMTALKSYE